MNTTASTTKYGGGGSGGGGGGTTMTPKNVHEGKPTIAGGKGRGGG